jgi:hypothetical protein
MAYNSPGANEPSLTNGLEYTASGNELAPGTVRYRPRNPQNGTEGPQTASISTSRECREWSEYSVLKTDSGRSGNLESVLNHHSVQGNTGFNPQIYKREKTSPPECNCGATSCSCDELYIRTHTVLLVTRVSELQR